MHFQRCSVSRLPVLPPRSSFLMLALLDAIVKLKAFLSDHAPDEILSLIPQTMRSRRICCGVMLSN